MLSIPINIPTQNVQREENENISYNNKNTNNYNINYFYHYRNENNNMPPSFSPSTPPEHKIIYKLIKTTNQNLNNYDNYNI